MKTLFVLAANSRLSQAIADAFPADTFRVIQRDSTEEAEPLLAHGFIDACLVDLELATDQVAPKLESLRRIAPRLPVILYASEPDAEFQEQAYLRGAAEVLLKPFRPQALLKALERLSPSPATAPPAVTPPSAPAAAAPPPGASPRSVDYSTLAGFSGILTHSLDAQAMLQQFLLLLREMLGINRAAMFLRGSAADAAPAPGRASHRLGAAGSVGLPPDVVALVELSLEGGIGGLVSHLGRIVYRNSPEAMADALAQREFGVLRGQVAVPLMDRGSVLGVAVFDSHLTGEPLSTQELELIFRLLEQIGLALRNIGLHQQLAGNEALFADILRGLSTACIVVDRSGAVLHANQTARRSLVSARPGGRELDLADLPPDLGARAHRVFETGTGSEPFELEFRDRTFVGTVLPLRQEPDGLPMSVLIQLEDQTQARRLRLLEAEATELHSFRKTVERLVPEMGNAMMSILPFRGAEAEFRRRFEPVFSAGCDRMVRLLDHLRCLASASTAGVEAIPLVDLLDESFQDALRHSGGKPVRLPLDRAQKISLRGSRPALKLAVSEVLLNALQAAPSNPKVAAQVHLESGAGKPAFAVVEVIDNGPGFTEESARRATELLYSATAAPRVGLGLSVALKILRDHGGRLEIPPPQPGQGGVVRLALPTA